MGRLPDSKMLECADEFALRSILLARALPKDITGQHLGLQLLLSGTSIGVHLHQAERAKSDDDIRQRLELAMEEARQAIYWLGLIRRSALLPRWRIGDMEDHAHALVSMCSQPVGKNRSMSGKSKE